MHASVDMGLPRQFDGLTMQCLNAMTGSQTIERAKASVSVMPSLVGNLFIPSVIVQKKLKRRMPDYSTVSNLLT